jgi:transposase
MLTTTYVGLDIHRKTVVATALDAEGTQLDQTTLGPSKEELQRYVEKLPGEKRVAMEACAMWESYFEAVEAAGATAILSNPLKTRLIAEATIKTDRVDSEALATLLRLNALPTAYAPPPEIRRVRHVVRDRMFYRRKITALMNHTYGQLIYRGISYRESSLSRIRGREGVRKLGIPGANRALDSIDFLLARSKELDREIHSFFLTSKEAQLLESIPGIGELGAVTLVAFLCPIDRFSHVDKLCSYAGLVPTTHQSGDVCYQGRLKRDCNHLLQTLLVELSWTSRRVEKRGSVARVANRVSRRRGKGKGSVAGAHKLLKIAFAVLKRGSPYSHDAPERPAAVRAVRDPRVAATRCVRGIALESPAANSLLAH